VSEHVGISCRELVELTTDYLEGALDQPRRREFEAHLELCDGCANYIEQMRETIRLTGMISEDGILPEERDKLLAAFRDWRRDR
jgi:anti-sigma factor RsiW